MITETKTPDTRELFAGLFAEYQDILIKGSAGFMNSHRNQAIDAFKKLGLPAKKNELYKYTPLADFFLPGLSLSLQPVKTDRSVKDLFRCDIADLDTNVILVLNGFYFNPAEELTIHNNGMIHGSLRAASLKFPELVSRYYAEYSDYKNDGITALNTAFAQDGVFIYVPGGVAAEKPFQIVNLLDSEQPLMTHFRNLFILEDHAEVQVLVCDHTLSGVDSLSNSVTEIHAGPGSRLDLSRVQNEHNNTVQISNTYVHQLESSSVKTNYITLNGGKVRNNLYVNLAGRGADNNSLGLFLTDGTQHVDNYTCVHHRVEDCTSSQLYKGILDENSTGAFNGKIHVWKDAQRTRAYQKNNNILLTDTAKMHTRPQLEIYADDVKCSHGATVGQLDDDALFYLRSRGIPYQESMQLLMYAFCREVINELGLEALKDRVSGLVEKRLRKELSHCHNCEIKCR